MGSNVQNNGRSSTIHENHQVVVVVIPFPAQGHLNQLLHLSRLIVSHSHHNIPVHYVGTTTHNRQAVLRVQGWDPKSISNIHFHGFQVPPFASPPPNPDIENTKFPSHLIPSFEASSHLREPVAALLQSLSHVSRRIVVIHDSIMASVAQDAINMPNVESYTFQSTSAFTLFMYLWNELGGRPDLGSFRVPEAPSLEGCFADGFMDFVNAQYEFLKLSDGSIYNTSRAIEGSYMELIKRFTGSNKHWAVGPFNPLSIEKNISEKKHLSIEWLDKQEAKSVIYVSFGTTTTFSAEEIEQIAIGLERSEKKFIWVLRDADKGNIFDGDEAPRHELPKGFEERIEGMGLIVRDWAPQLEILSHPSIGGFMSHSGWNSSMESMSMGVPIAAWPMHSDQPRNAVLITEVLKVGLVVKDWGRRKELVTASDVENAVTRLMGSKEGDEMRGKALGLKDAIHSSMDEGGVSRKEMDSFIAHITR